MTIYTNLCKRLHPPSQAFTLPIASGCVSQDIYMHYRSVPFNAVPSALKSPKRTRTS